MSPLWGLFVSYFLLLALGLHSYAALRLDGRDAVLHYDFFYRSLRTGRVKNLMQPAILAQSGPLYLMILGLPENLPAWPLRRLKPRCILRALRHD